MNNSKRIVVHLRKTIFGERPKFNEESGLCICSFSIHNWSQYETYSNLSMNDICTLQKDSTRYRICSDCFTDKAKRVLLCKYLVFLGH